MLTSLFDEEVSSKIRLERHESAMESIQIIPVNSDQMAPLYSVYPNSLTPCKASMSLLPSGQVKFSCDLQRGSTFDVYYGRERAWEIPPELTSDELKKFGERVKELLIQVHQGLCIAWSEKDCEEYGVLTPEAQEASDKIQDECDRLFVMVKWQDIGVYIIKPSDYFDGESPEDYGLDAHSSDDDFRREAAGLLEHFNKTNLMMYGDLFEIIKEWVQNYE